MALLQAEKSKAPHFEAELKLRPKPVFNRIEEIRQTGQASFLHYKSIFDQYPISRLQEDVPEYQVLGKKGSIVYDAKRSRQHLEPWRGTKWICILKNTTTAEWQHLSNFEILTIQLNTFEKYLELAIAHHQHNLIVIHGVGTGKLKDEIHEILNARREVRSYINQYDPRYGYGATEIFL